MMNKLEEAIIYATVMHQGRVRKFESIPYILHPMEVAQILSTMTRDEDIITAGILHDIVEDTDGTLAEIEKRFGKRVAALVSSESENKYPDEAPENTWLRRKEESLRILKNSEDIGVQMLWLADKLANIRSLAGIYSEKGEALWKSLHQSDSKMQCWYYRSIAEIVELSLNKTGAFKELIKHINYIWPGTFDTEKSRYRKYKEVSIDGCEKIGQGAKGDVYRYNDELIIKVYNNKNTYKDVEREIALSRKAFILGIPTAISFGIVAVGSQYGSMYELVNSETISTYIERSPSQVGAYAKIMAQLARSIHSTKVKANDGFQSAYDRIYSYIHEGIGYENVNAEKKCMELIDSLPAANTLIHGDFHTGNVFLHEGEPLLIDMDRISVGHPIFEISDLYYFYVVLGEDNPDVIEKFMGFSYETSLKFFDTFLMEYLGTEDETRINEVKKKASIISYSRLIRKFLKKGAPSEKEKMAIGCCVKKISELADMLQDLEF